MVKRETALRAVLGNHSINISQFIYTAARGRGRYTDV